MPYGVRKDIDGQDVDFDHIYKHVIQEAVKTAGLTCIRCDDLHAPGWVPKRMLEHIFEDRVAVVDTSTLNANVFYELGVRHALKKSVTVLMRREGTSSPFNIQGLSAVSYGTTPQSEAAAIAAISDAITSGLNNPKNIDSLVYQALPDLNLPARQPKPLTSVQTFAFALVKNPEKRLALITGDREDIKVGDIWVNSENTDMQMDGYYGRSTSAMIRYLGATLDRRWTGGRRHHRQGTGRAARRFDRGGARHGVRHRARSAGTDQRGEAHLSRRLRARGAEGGLPPHHQARALREKRLQQGRRTAVPGRGALVDSLSHLRHRARSRQFRGARRALLQRRDRGHGVRARPPDQGGLLLRVVGRRPRDLPLARAQSQRPQAA